MHFVKREEKTPVVSSSGNPSTDSPYSEGNAMLYSGTFTSESYTNVLYGNTSTYNDSKALFFKKPSGYPTDSNCVNVDSLILNGKVLNYHPGYPGYQNYNSDNLLGDESWEVKGSKDIHSFKFTSRNNGPTWSYIGEIPAEIDLNTGFTLEVRGVNHMTEAYVYFGGCASSTQGSIRRTLQAGNNIVTFTKEDCSKMLTCSNGIISINIINKRVLNFFGKDFSFIKQRSYTKTFTVKK